MNSKYFEKISYIYPMIDSAGDGLQFKGLGTLLVEKDKHPEALEFSLGVLAFMLDNNKQYNLKITSLVDGKKINEFSTEPHLADKKLSVGNHYLLSYAPEITIMQFRLGVYEFIAELTSDDELIDTNRCFLLLGEVIDLDTFDY